MKRKDAVFSKWMYQTFGSRKGNQFAARAVQKEYEEKTLDVLWGLVPVYTGKVIRRRAVA